MYRIMCISGILDVPHNYTNHGLAVPIFSISYQWWASKVFSS